MELLKKIQYITNEQHTPQAVVLPMAVWEQIKKDLEAYHAHLAFYAELKSAFDELAELKSGKKKGINLNDLLA